MKLYYQINLATTSLVGEPTTPPPLVNGLSDEDLADLSFLPEEHGFSGIGFWPVETNDPAFAPDYQMLDAPVTFTIDAGSKRVLSTSTVRAKSPEEMEPLRAQGRAAVMTKRDQVIDGGFSFAGNVFQTAPTDRENISGAAQLAFMAMVAAGKLAGDLRWSDPDQDFGWIASDNTVVPMDAPTVIAFGKAIAGFKSGCIFYARAMKDQIDAAQNPATVDIEAGWPA